MRKYNNLFRKILWVLKNFRIIEINSFKVYKIIKIKLKIYIKNCNNNLCKSIDDVGFLLLILGKNIAYMCYNFNVIILVLIAKNLL